MESESFLLESKYKNSDSAHLRYAGCDTHGATRCEQLLYLEQPMRCGATIRGISIYNKTNKSFVRVVALRVEFSLYRARELNAIVGIRTDWLASNGKDVGLGNF